MFGWTSFGKVKYKDKIYNHDIWVDADGNAHSREIPDHHYVKAEELRQYLTPDTIAIVVGIGQTGCVHIADDAMQLIAEKQLELHRYETPQAIKEYNKIAPTRKTIAIIHVTC